ncbi:hypothetical protein BDV96DRAFT_276516 [Lophiotrema nucula]|uniref:Uncharacterized protein n=1 Tax=Lophiotrema nucula TaxID=690887 RepID=A0A6A5ZN45_9PLEO|nr:hypothetical protein BDV96DRAFT_276516 [Lophiotrema nucula]
MSVLRALAARRSPFIAQRAAFHQSIARPAGKETKLHTEGREDEIEQEKNQSLKEQKQGKANWKDSLASDSESIVKADRGEIEASEETIKKLQEESDKLLKK